MSCVCHVRHVLPCHAMPCHATQRNAMQCMQHKCLVRVCLHVSIPSSFCLPVVVCLFDWLIVCLSVCLFTSVCLFVYLYIIISFLIWSYPMLSYLSASIYFFIYLSCVCLSVCITGAVPLQFGICRLIGWLTCVVLGIREWEFMLPFPHSCLLPFGESEKSFF